MAKISRGRHTAIGSAPIERDNFRADALASGEDTRQHGREGRQRRPVDFGEVG